MDIVSLVLSVLRLTTPILIAASGSMFCELAGIQNLGLEGMMLGSAFAGMLGSLLTGNVYIGILASIACGGLIALVHGLICVEWGGIQNISGLGIYMLMPGLTAYFMRSIFGASISAQVSSLQTSTWLAGIPVVGKYLVQMSPITYLAFLMVPLLYYYLKRTPGGLRIQAVGDDPETLETAGVDVWRLRIRCVVFSGLMAGLAGAYLSLGQLNRFAENMVAGRGMLAVIAVKMGRWNPVGVLCAALLFGFFDALQLQFQIQQWVAIPTELVQMIPLAAGMVALALSSGENATPRAFGKPYVRRRD